MTLPLLSLIPALARPFRESVLNSEFSFVASPPTIPGARIDSFSNPQFGIEVRVSQPGSVKAIFLYGSGHEEFAKYTGELPEGLTFASTRREVRRVFGQPSMSAEPQVLEYLGLKGAWDRFDLPMAHIHFQYHRYQPGIEMITLMAPGTAP